MTAQDSWTEAVLEAAPAPVLLPASPAPWALLAPAAPAIPVVAPVQPPQAPASRSDAHDLARSLLVAEPTVAFKSVLKAASNLGIPMNRGIFRAVQREIAGTVREKGAPHEAVPLPTSPTMTFVIGFLRDRPTATIEEVQRAADEEGHSVFPMVFERARQIVKEQSDAKLTGDALAKLIEGRVVVREPREKPVRRMGPARQFSPASAFANAFVKEHPGASYAEVQAAAGAEGFTIAPITFGRARKLAGLEKRTSPAPRRQDRPVLEAAPTPAPVRREQVSISALPPGSIPTRSSRRAEDIVGDLAKMMERLQGQRAELRETLNRIATLATDCLRRIE